MFDFFLQKISFEENFLHFFFLFFSLFLFSGLVTGLRLFFIFFLFGVIIVYVKTKNLLLATLPLLAFSLQFVGPNKFYFVEAIPKKDILELIYREGYSLGYGINISNIMIVLGIIFVFRDIYLKKSYEFLKTKDFKILALCCVVFITVGLYSLFQYSPFTALSLTWTFQYAQLFLVALICLYCFKIYGKRAHILLISGLIWFTIFQSLVVLFQFLNQSSSGFVFEVSQGSAFYTGLDENNAIFRPPGTFMVHNQASFLLALIACVLIPLALQNKKTLYFFASFLAFVAIILIQSRSIWISVFIAMIGISIALRKQLSGLIQEWGYRRLALYAVALLLFVGPIILPRILLSSNFFYRGAGLPIRLDMYKEAVQVIGNGFLFGFGPGTAEYITHNFFPNGVTTLDPAPVHNGFLQLMVEMGVVGLVVFLLPFLYVLRSLPFKNIFMKFKPKYANQLSFLFCCWIILFYYMFLPHSGIVEFSYLGIILSLGYSRFSEENYV